MTPDMPRSVTRAEATVPADPDVVFATPATSIGRPTGTNRMASVVETPDAIEPGSEWVVEFRGFGRSWRSRSTLEILDRTKRRFACRSRTHDGNPSYAKWEWTVADDPAGSRVHVSWSLRPVTFWRRMLLVRMRARQLARAELSASLAALAVMVTADEANATADRKLA